MCICFLDPWCQIAPFQTPPCSKHLHVPNRHHNAGGRNNYNSQLGRLWTGRQWYKSSTNMRLGAAPAAPPRDCSGDCKALFTFHSEMNWLLLPTCSSSPIESFFLLWSACLVAGMILPRCFSCCCSFAKLDPFIWNAPAVWRDLHWQPAHNQPGVGRGL